MLDFIKKFFLKSRVSDEDICRPAEFSDMSARSTGSSSSKSTPKHSHKRLSMAEKILEDFGFDDACLLFYNIVNNNIDANNETIYYMKVAQFVKEDFDAAYTAGGYARSFVEEVCEEGVDWFKGAMTEDAEFKIDEPGGPQQTLLIITSQLMSSNQDIAVKMRCEIIRIFYEDLKIFMDTSANSTPVGVLSNSMTYMMNRRRRFERLKQLSQIINSRVNVKN